MLSGVRWHVDMAEHQMMMKPFERWGMLIWRQKAFVYMTGLEGAGACASNAEKCLSLNRIVWTTTHITHTHSHVGHDKHEHDIRCVEWNGCWTDVPYSPTAMTAMTKASKRASSQDKSQRMIICYFRLSNALGRPGARCQANRYIKRSLNNVFRFSSFAICVSWPLFCIYMGSCVCVWVYLSLRYLSRTTTAMAVDIDDDVDNDCHSHSLSAVQFILWGTKANRNFIIRLCVCVCVSVQT